jgi:hypothetical protein
VLERWTRDYSPTEASVKNNECIIEQYRGTRLVRVFVPADDGTYPWRMEVNGKSYPRTNGWVLSKILPTLVDGSRFTTRVVPLESVETTDPGGGV